MNRFSDCDVTPQIIISDTIRLLTFKFSDHIELSLWECTLGRIYEQPLVRSFRQQVLSADLSIDTLCVISQLVHCMESSYGINIMNIAKQTGVLDCGLYICNSNSYQVVIDQNPTTIGYDEDYMRSHLIDCLKSGIMVPFR